VVTTIRPAQAVDREAILRVVRSAFATIGRDGREEVDIVTRTWELGAAPMGLELVAVDEDGVVGHVLGAVGRLGDRPVVGVAPLSVAPSMQGRGIGSALMIELLRRLDEAGWPLVLLLGDPHYYSRFGFAPAAALGISYPPVGAGNPHFMVCQLSSFAAHLLDAGLGGEFRYGWERL
jgi:putative acetyltransferase